MLNKVSNNRIIRIVLSSLLALFLIVGISIGVYAAYTHSLHAQRTIAPYGVGIRFSSNYLVQGDASSNVNTIYTTDASASGTNPATVVTICNYTQGKQNDPSQNDISYVLTAKLVKIVNDEYVDAASSDFSNGEFITVKIGENTVTFNNSNGSNTYSFNGTLAGRRANVDVYELVLSKGFATEKPNLYIMLSADPTDESLPIISGIFRADVRSEGETKSWSGTFSDDMTNYDPSDYDGYNYIITGFGEGECNLTWDKSKVNINYISLSNILSNEGSNLSENGNQMSLTFEVDSNVENRYEIQFYKVDIDENTTWETMNEVITFSFQ